MEMIKNMSQERMEWLERVRIRSAEDIRTRGPQKVYNELLEEGHPEDEHFYCALFGAVEDVDTMTIWRNMKEHKEAEGR